MQIKPIGPGIQPLVQRQSEEEEEEELIQAKPFAMKTIPLLQRQVESDEEEEQAVATIQMKPFPGARQKSLLGVGRDLRAMRSTGRPLDCQSRKFMEARFGYDFSNVRIHTGPRAANAAGTLCAKAYTAGSDIVFSSGQYSPMTSSGKHLLAHELTHVVQQGQSFPHSKRFGKVRPRMNGMPPDIQRAVTYAGALVRHDINPLDPTTAPAGDQAAVGHTALHVNGQDVQSLSQDQKINALFPLPTVATLSSICMMANRNLNVRTQNLVRVLTPAPWTRTLPKSDLGTIFGGALGSVSSCGGSGNTTVTLTGHPNDLSLRAWSLQGEMQHARDDKCIVDRYVKGYEADVSALPDSFPRGYLGFGSCNARLEERLKRRERAAAFSRDWGAFANSYDGAGGSHTVRASSSVGTGCSTITLTLRTGPLPLQTRTCTQWSPP